MLFVLTCLLLLLTVVLTLPVSPQPYPFNMTINHTRDIFETYDNGYIYLDDDDTYSYDVGEFLGDARNVYLNMDNV